jgi:hypothetical protein
MLLFGFCPKRSQKKETAREKCRGTEYRAPAGILGTVKLTNWNKKKVAKRFRLTTAPSQLYFNEIQMIVATVCLTYKSVYGEKLPVEEAIKRIASYPLSFVLKTVSRMSLILEGPVSEIEKKQIELCQRLLEPEQAFLIEQAIHKKAYEDRFAPRIEGVEEKTIIFSRTQLAVTTKMGMSRSLLKIR